MEHYGGFASEPQNETSFSDVTRLLRRQRRVILGAGICGLVLALILSLFMTTKYSSEAHVELNPSEGNKLGLSDFNPDAGASSEDLATGLSTLAEMLRSEPVVLETIQQNNLEATGTYRPPSNSKYTLEASLPLVDAPLRRTRILKKFQSNLAIKTIPGTRLVQVSFADPDPKRSAAVVNSLIANYATEYIHRHYSNSEQASDWLKKQIADLKQQVAASESKVTDFEQNNGFFGIVGTGTDTQSPLLQKLVAMNQSIAQAEAARIQKEALVNLLAHRDPEAIVGLGSNPQVANGVFGPDMAILQTLRLQEAQLESQYTDMQAKYGARYPALIETKSQLASVRASIEKSAESLRSRAVNDYIMATKNEDMLKHSFDEQVAAANKLNDKATQFQLLSKEAEGNRTLYEGLLTKMREAQVASNVRGSNVTVVDSALPMATPSSPNYLINAAIGLAGGLLIGLVVGFYRSRSDQAFESLEALHLVAPVPILGIIPSVRRLKHMASQASLTGIIGDKAVSDRVQRGGSDDQFAAEVYNRIRTAIPQYDTAAGPRTILVTSPLNGDGKSNTVLELARAFASAGARVLAIDGDLRSPANSGRSNKGLRDLLRGTGSSAECILPDKSLPNLFFLAAGTSVGSPLPLLESSNFASLLADFKNNFDCVIIDSPPVSFFADVSVMASHADVTLLVVRAGVTSSQAIRRSCNTLRESGSNLIGIVVNDLELDSPNFYNYYGYRGKDFARSYANA